MTIKVISKRKFLLNITVQEKLNGKNDLPENCMDAPKLCPIITQVIETNRIPFTADRVPFGWLVFRILKRWCKPKTQGEVSRAYLKFGKKNLLL